VFVFFFPSALVGGIFGSPCADLALQKAKYSALLSLSSPCWCWEGHREVGMGRRGRNYVTSCL